MDLIDLSRRVNSHRVRHLIEGVGKTGCMICKKSRESHTPSGHRHVARHMLALVVDIHPSQLCHGDMIICNLHGGAYSTLWVLR